VSKKVKGCASIRRCFVSHLVRAASVTAGLLHSVLDVRLAA